MKKVLIVILILLIGIGLLGWKIGWFNFQFETSFENPLSESLPSRLQRTEVKNIGYLAQYNFENLKMRENKASKIENIGKVLVVEEARQTVLKKYLEDGIKKENNFESRAISFESNGKKISGMMNVPDSTKASSRRSPAIIMIRGFAEVEGYFIGSGSWKAADELARNGFVTISLDFLGFGLSDQESTDILEARFEKPVSVLDLIESVKGLDFVDPEKIGIWAHSNGGQIAISILEITGGNYPTVLWAPMTNPFPKSVLETVDDESEGSLIVKQKIEDFEKEYDSKLYSIDNFYNWINSPILIHQGTADVWCEVKWQQNLQSKLKKLGKEINLDVRKGDDHNLKQSWDKVIKMDIEFFKEKFNL
ncbi:MAG: prolyl oligopeptidase family serine peptidase [Candidatus Shapirobacteria bacterium]|nr:prolyl oligopeptidase family serine peptidase [Candidatus Shapirobacteria bacterium]